ncbi:hypothetical protein ACNKHO_24150 [Shigella flexneri]
MHLNPNVSQLVNRILGHVENVRSHPAAGLSAICLADERRLADSDRSCGIQEEAPSPGTAVLVIARTTTSASGHCLYRTSGGTDPLVTPQVMRYCMTMKSMRRRPRP